MLGLERRRIGRQLLAVLAVVAVVGGAVAPALAASPSTWDGRIELSGTPSDGTTYQYDVQEVDAVDDFAVNVTGVESTETDIDSAALADGETMQIGTAGDAISQGSVTFEGRTSTSSGSWSGVGDSSGLSESLSVGGNIPTADAELTVSATKPTTSGTLSQGPGSPWTQTVSTPDQVSRIEVVTQHTEGNYPVHHVDIDLDGDGNYELSKTHEPDAYGTHTWVFTGSWDTSGEITIRGRSNLNSWGPRGESYAVEGEHPGTVDVSVGETTHSFSSLTGTQTKSISIPSGDVPLDYSQSSAGGSTDIDLSWTTRTATEDPSLDLGNDGSPEVSHQGVLLSGETATFDLPSLDTATDAASVGLTAGSVDATVEYQEKTHSQDVAIGVNTENGGGWMNYSSTLPAGETASLLTNESWIRSGTNTVDVAFNDALSADAPEPNVQLDYQHRAATEQSVSVDGEQWTERWNASRTWASDRKDATVTIPFGDSVVAARDVTVLSNGSQVGAASTSFNGTHLEVGLGDVVDGETTRVVAAGSKVQTTNGSIEVVEPTPLGESLDSKFKIVERSSGFQIDTGATAENQWLHYAHGESWTDPNGYALLEDGGGQSLHFPNAPAGGTARVSTLAVDVDTTQDVAIDVAKSGSLVFDVEPGPAAGDDVTFNYVGASSGTEYELVSLDRDGYRISRDSGSTAILRDDDSAETVQIRPINASGSTSTLEEVGGGGGGIPPGVDPRANPYALLAISGVVIMGGVGLAAWRPSVPMWAVVPLLVPVTLIVIATQSPGTLRQLLAGKIGSALEQVGPALILLGGTVVAYVVYKLAQSLGPDRTVVDFSGLRGGKK